MTDAELLDWLARCVDLNRRGTATASTQISAKFARRIGHNMLYRLSDGPWRPTLREAIEAHRGRAMRDT